MAVSAGDRPRGIYQRGEVRGRMLEGGGEKEGDTMM